MGYITQKKIKIAKQIKKISFDNIAKDLEKLRLLKPSINPSVNYGNMFLDYYFFPYRLNTVTAKNINYFQFIESDKINKNYVISFMKNNNYPKTYGGYFKAFALYFGSISQFKPSVAKHIYYKFKPNIVLDPFAGWGGRLLGAMIVNDTTQYIGFDTNKNLKVPYKKMMKDLKINNRSKIIFKDSSKVNFKKYKYDMVFTSPPYFTKEKYDFMKQYKTKIEFVEKLLYPVIINSYDGLSKPGRFIINASKELYDEITKILGKSNKKIPYKIQKREKTSKYNEYIYIWNK